MSLISPTLIQSVAQSPRRDVTQPAGEAQSSRRTSLAAPLPIPQASSSQATAGNSASIAHDLGDLPPLFDPAFLAAWRETQGQTVDAEAL